MIYQNQVVVLLQRKCHIGKAVLSLTTVSFM